MTTNESVGEEITLEPTSDITQDVKVIKDRVDMIEGFLRNLGSISIDLNDRTEVPIQKLYSILTDVKNWIACVLDRLSKLTSQFSEANIVVNQILARVDLLSDFDAQVSKLQNGLDGIDGSLLFGFERLKHGINSTINNQTQTLLESLKHVSSVENKLNLKALKEGQKEISDLKEGQKEILDLLKTMTKQKSTPDQSLLFTTSQTPNAPSSTRAGCSSIYPLTLDDDSPLPDEIEEDRHSENEYSLIPTQSGRKRRINFSDVSVSKRPSLGSVSHPQASNSLPHGITLFAPCPSHQELRVYSGAYKVLINCVKHDLMDLDCSVELIRLCKSYYTKDNYTRVASMVSSTGPNLPQNCLYAGIMRRSGIQHFQGIRVDTLAGENERNFACFHCTTVGKVCIILGGHVAGDVEWVILPLHSKFRPKGCDYNELGYWVETNVNMRKGWKILANDTVDGSV